MPVTLSSAINASASALNVERTRVEVAISNMANVDSTHGGSDGGAYRRRGVIVSADGGTNFDGSLKEAVGVKVQSIVEDQSPLQVRFEPTHPDADASGYVKLPNVDTKEEMVDLLAASRAYQANLAAVNIIRDMVQKALDLGRA